jgi:hypothetical protein
LATTRKPSSKGLIDLMAPKADAGDVKPSVDTKATQAATAPSEDEEPLQRLTLDIPLSLHIAIKTGCAMRRTKMREEVLALLEAHYRP